MEEEEAFVFAGVLRAIRSDVTGYKSFSARELVENLRKYFDVDLAPEHIRNVMVQACEISTDSSMIEHITSRFASERFVLRVSEPREIAKVCDSVEVWDKASRAGDGWLREALLNIHEEVLVNAPTQLEAEAAQYEAKSVPASDRYVSTLDNENAFAEVKLQLNSVREDVSSSNSIEDEGRLIALSEIALFEAAICQPRLAQDIIERFVAFCSAKLSSWVGGAAVGLLIDKLKALIENFFASTFSVG